MTEMDRRVEALNRLYAAMDPDVLDELVEVVTALDKPTRDEAIRRSMAEKDQDDHHTFEEAMIVLIHHCVALGAPHRCEVWRDEAGQCRMCARLP